MNQFFTSTSFSGKEVTARPTDSRANLCEKPRRPLTSLALKSMARSFFLSCIFLFPIFAVASDPMPKSAPNCSIELPPDGAGEDAAHTTLVRVFPRKSAVGSDYSGCQTAWIQKGETWEKFSVMYFQKGQLQTWLSSDDETKPLGLVCRFADGKLAAKQPEKCYVPMAGLKRTFAPGCVAEMIKSGKMEKACGTSLER